MNLYISASNRKHNSYYLMYKMDIKATEALGYDKDINKEDMNVLLNELKHIEETFIPLMKVMTKVEDAMKCECEEEPNVKNTITTDFKMNEADMDKIINTFLKGII